MRIATIMTAWQRPALTDIVLRYYRNFSVPGVEFVHHICISPEDPYREIIRRSARKCGFRRMSAPNMPFDKKWNAILRKSEKCDPDAVLILGSDDLVNAEFIIQAVMGLQLHDFSQSDWVHFYHIIKDQLIRRRMTQNGIRLFSRQAVEKMEWKLWADRPFIAMAMDKAQDMHIAGKLSCCNLKRNDQAVVLDIKGAGVSRVPFWKYERNLQGDDLDVEPFFEQHFTDAYKEIRHLVGLPN